MSEPCAFYISERRHRRTGIPFRYKLYVLLFLLLLLVLVLNLQFFPLLAALAEVEAVNTVEGLLAKVIVREMQKAPATYSDVVTLTYKSDGSVASLSADTAKLLLMQATLLLALLEAINAEGELIAEVPFSSLLGLNFLSSRPSVTVPLRREHDLNGHFTSQFEERGINQTRHAIQFCVSLTVLVLVPSSTQRVRIEKSFPLAETVIVGNVPDAYTSISRLTSDITEEEIDDIYDFGAER
ncbi:MAG: sporulation protein YunB [Clostridia bacterium]|nr:sporulation protein YunB [Clostridia bacterium]